LMTGKTTCAYCGLDFVKCFTNWLQMHLDHVVPQDKTFNDKLHIPHEWTWDYTNRVLACGACNRSFSPRSEFKEDYIKSVKACAACNGVPDAKCRKCLEAFYTLRDCIFQDRKERIRTLRAAEEEIFKRRPWEQPG